MKVVFFSAGERAKELDETMRAFPGVTFVTATNSESLRSALAGAEILVAANSKYSRENARIIRETGTSLRWIQFTTSGIDIAVEAGLPSGVVVTNMAGLRAFAVAEHAFSLMLGLVRRLRATEQARVAEDWCRECRHAFDRQSRRQASRPDRARRNRPRCRAQGQGVRHACHRRHALDRCGSPCRRVAPAQRARRGLCGGRYRHGVRQL